MKMAVLPHHLGSEREHLPGQEPATSFSPSSHPIIEIAISVPGKGQGGSRRTGNAMRVMLRRGAKRSDSLGRAAACRCWREAESVPPDCSGTSYSSDCQNEAV
jgi:hypothetical protein